MGVLYKPKGKAKEYGEYAVNIYKGCPHECFYCFAPSVLHKERGLFQRECGIRESIVEKLREQLASSHITGKLVHLCFTCDPYPTGRDNTTTREVITLLKEFGNNVQILTKGDGRRDFDLLDGNDWYGITLDGTECKAPLQPRIDSLIEARKRGIKTWVSFEPVTNEASFFADLHAVAPFVDKVKIGKLNYFSSDIDWATFGHKAEAVCKNLGIDYYIKDSLRALM